MYKIIKIERILPEVYITITDGTYEFIVFSDSEQFELEKNTEFYAFCATNIVRSYENKCAVSVTDNITYSQHIVGKVFDKENSIVEVGGVKIHIVDYIPGDITTGEFIEFDVARIDI